MSNVFIISPLEKPNYIWDITAAEIINSIQKKWPTNAIASAESDGVKVKITLDNQQRVFFLLIDQFMQSFSTSILILLLLHQLLYGFDN